MKIIQRVHHVRSGILTFGELRKPNYEKQSVTIPRFFPVPVLFSGTCTGTLFRDQFFPVTIPVPPKKICTKFPGIFRYQIFPILIPVLFSGTKFFRHRYHPKRNRDVTFCWEDEKHLLFLQITHSRNEVAEKCILRLQPLGSAAFQRYDKWKVNMLHAINFFFFQCWK